MVLIEGILILVLFFVGVSIFDKNLRDKILEKIQDLINKLFTKAPPTLDKIVTDPLREKLTKLQAGRETGGIETLS